MGLSLRLFNFSELSLGNDELSVLARIQYDSFSELILEGVKADVHPAGIQVLAYYWSGIFGDSPLALRFPFLLTGLLSIFLAFKLGASWFSEESGLLTAACMASLQYFITLGVYARPYAIVLCFSMAMIYFLTRIIKESETANWEYIAYACFSVLCLYFHYFSFLLVGSSALMGLLFVSGKKNKKFFLSLLLIPILYLPHLGIFIHHLEKGGSEWIGKPDASFLVNYFSYAFHFSFLLVSFILLSVLGLYLWKGRGAKKEWNRFRIISAALFLLPLGLGFLYSVWRAPVLHSNGLLASFPFFLLFIFSFVPKLNDFQKALFTGCLLLLSVWTLIDDRQHYKLFYNRSAEALTENIKESEERFNERKIEHFLQLHSPYYADYYFDKSTSRPSIKSYNLEELGGVKGLRTYLKNSEADMISLAWLSKTLPDYFIPVLREFYPGIEQRENFFISESWLFSKDSLQEQKIIFREEKDEGNLVAELRIEENKSGKLAEQSSWRTTQEFGPYLELSLEDQKLMATDELWADFELKTDQDQTEIKVVVEYLPPLGKSQWFASPATQYISDPLGWNRIHFYRRLQHLGIKESKGKLKIYIWNPARESYSIKRYSVRVEEGNPWLYGLVEKLP